MQPSAKVGHTGSVTTAKDTAVRATGSSRAARSTAIRTQRRKWRRASATWDDHVGPTIAPVVDAVLREVGGGPAGVVVDIGAGTGALSLPLASLADKVVAVDVSDAMLEQLAAAAAKSGITNVEIRSAPIENLELPAGSVDNIVSNYALHHLLDRDKEMFVQRSAEWLRPGGRLVIGDMMFGRGASAEDRVVIKSKVKALAVRGPGGWWRIAKNAVRFSFRLSERPLSAERWTILLATAGFVDVKTERVVSEAAIVSGRRP